MPKREGQFLYKLGDGEWNIPTLRTLLEEVLPQHTSFQDFEMIQEVTGARTPGFTVECTTKVGGGRPPGFASD